MDSTALLHLLVQARRQAPSAVGLRAIHIDHGLQAAAAQFRTFCRRTARRWRVPLAISALALRPAAGESVEAVAREARYGALAAALRPDELLLTAQHADDQVETALLALLRGAGPAGLAAMPAALPFGTTWLLRPLLDLTRSQIETYVKAQGVEWVQDPSNAELRFDRNYLRARVLPPLRERWPALAQTVGRSARHCAVADACLMQLARLDLAAATDGPDLEIAILRRFSGARRAAVLRLWMADRGLQAPELRQLAQFQGLMEARQDAHPELRLPGLVLRRHAGRLVLEALPQGRANSRELPQQLWSWRHGELQLPAGGLSIAVDLHGDLDLAQLPPRLQVQSAVGSGGRSQRKLLQELEVPNWQRERLPLLFGVAKQGQVGKLLAVADLWLDNSVRSTAKTLRRGRILWQEQP
jgi:tRNA(Ile)-lysidine synthase